MKPLNLTNKKFGKLTALVRVENNRHGKAMWSCLYDCGNYSIVNTADLTSGKVTSCGCNRAKHGLSKSRFHKIWTMMKQRCNNPNVDFYYCYGGKGISYQESWEDFENFYRDMFPTYRDDLSLERIDVLKGYSKENCTWIPISLQARNTALRSTNKTGITGIMFKKINGVLYLKAAMSVGKGKKISKMMSLNKHSYDHALNTLQDWLRENRKIHNYGENHGK